MSQESADLPHEVEWSHDHDTDPGGSTPTILGPAIVTPASSNSNSAGELASETNCAGSVPASPAVVLHAGEDDNNAESSKLAAIPAVLSAGKDNDADGSKLTFPAVLCAREDTNAGSKMGNPMLHVSVDDKARFKLDSPAVLCAELTSQVVRPHADEDKNKNAESIFASPAVIHAVEDIKTGSKLSIQEMPHAIEDDTAVSKLAGATLQDGDGNNIVSKLAIQVVPPDNKDNNTGSKLTEPVLELQIGEDKDNIAKSNHSIPSGVDAGGNNGKEGKNAVDGEEGGDAKVVAAGGRTGSGGGAPSNTIKDAHAAIANWGKGRGRGKGKGKGVAATAEEKALHIWTEKERRKKMKTMFSSLHALLPQLPEKADKSTIVGEAVTYIQSLEGIVKKLETLKQERIRAQQVAAGAGCSRAAAPTFPAPPPPPPQQPAAAAPTREAVLADMVQTWNAQDDLMAELRAAASAVVAASAAGSSTSAAAAAAAAPAAPAAVPALQTWSGPNIVVCVAGHDAFINIFTPRRPGMLTRMLAVLEKHRVGVVATTVSSDHVHTFFTIQARINAATPPPPMLPENVTVLDRYKLAVSEMLHAVAN
ncbi:unnamed protein product [Urochloa humidicola]